MLFDLGQTYEKMGQLDLAGDTYVKFIETDPNNPLVEGLWEKFEKLAGSTGSGQERVDK